MKEMAQTIRPNTSSGALTLTCSVCSLVSRSAAWLTHSIWVLASQQKADRTRQPWCHWSIHLSSCRTSFSSHRPGVPASRTQTAEDRRAPSKDQCHPDLVSNGTSVALWHQRRARTAQGGGCRTTEAPPCGSTRAALDVSRGRFQHT